MIPNDLRKVWDQGKEVGLDHCIPNSSWAYRWAKASCAAVAVQGTWKHQYSALVGTVRSVCYTLHHSFTVLSDHLLLSMVALPVRGRSRFPSPNHTELLSLLSFLLSKPKTLLVSPDMWMIQGSSGGGKLGNVCVVGMLSRTFSKTNVRFDTNNCRGWEKTLCYRELGWFAQLPRVGVTHCKDRRWKEQLTPGEMRSGQGGWPNGSTEKCCTPCSFLVVFNFQNAPGACWTF